MWHTLYHTQRESRSLLRTWPGGRGLAAAWAGTKRKTWRGLLAFVL